MAASYEARAYGIHGGMATARARRLCPAAVVVDTSFESYVAAGREVFAIFERFSAVVEPGSMEEAFLEVPRGPAEAGGVAARLRRAVREQAGLPLSVGVARTKVLAKIASGAAKPDGLVVVAPERELEFLHPLTVERVWGIGPATARKLRAGGVRTVGDAAALGEPDLMRLVGKAAGRYVHAIAHNRDRRPVQRRRGRRSFGAQRALGRRGRSRAELEAVLADLAERLTRRMQRKGRAGRTVVLRLRFGDYTRTSRSYTLAAPTAEPAAVVAAARELLGAAAPLIERRGITLVGVTVTNIAPASAQLPLFEAPPRAPPSESASRDVGPETAAS